MNLESLQCILIECGNKDDGLNVLGTNARKHIEAVHLGHLNVEKDKIRRECVDCFDSLVPIATLVEDLDLRIFFQQHTKIASRQRLVVDDYSSNLSGHLIESG